MPSQGIGNIWLVFHKSKNLLKFTIGTEAQVAL